MQCARIPQPQAMTTAGTRGAGAWCAASEQLSKARTLAETLRTRRAVEVNDTTNDGRRRAAYGLRPQGPSCRRICAFSCKPGLAGICINRPYKPDQFINRGTPQRHVMVRDDHIVKLADQRWLHPARSRKRTEFLRSFTMWQQVRFRSCKLQKRTVPGLVDD